MYNIILQKKNYNKKKNLKIFNFYNNLDYFSNRKFLIK